MASAIYAMSVLASAAPEVDRSLSFHSFCRDNPDRLMDPGYSDGSFQIRTVLSRLPETRNEPSRAKANEYTLS
jgi:hypothetical protein